MIFIKRHTYDGHAPETVEFNGILNGQVLHIHVNGPDSIHYYEKTNPEDPDVKTIVALGLLMLRNDIHYHGE